MQHPILASKKNVILALIALMVVLGVASYVMKQGSRAVRGEFEIVTHGAPLAKPQYEFIRSQAHRISAVTDLRTPLSLPGQIFESAVRIIDNNYPLFGKVDIDNTLFKDVFTADRKSRSFGVAVNQLFLDKTGMKTGDIFTMGKNSYQLRGVIRSLPDTSGQELNNGPLLVIRNSSVHGSGMFKIARIRDFRYFIINRALPSASLEKLFKKKFPRSPATLIRLDEKK